MNPLHLASSTHLNCSAAETLLRLIVVTALFNTSFVNGNFAYAQDFDMKFPADLSNHNDGSTAGSAAPIPKARVNSGMPNELMMTADPISTPSTDPLMEEGSPIPGVINPPSPEKKGSGSVGKPATVASATELFEAGKKFETNQEFGRALSSYEEAIKLFRTSKKEAGSKLVGEVAQKYAALLRQLNNPLKAANIEKEFGPAQQ